MPAGFLDGLTDMQSVTKDHSVSTAFDFLAEDPQAQRCGCHWLWHINARNNWRSSAKRIRVWPQLLKRMSRRRYGRGTGLGNPVSMKKFALRGRKLNPKSIYMLILYVDS